MRTGALAEIQCLQQARLVGIGNVEHRNPSRLVHGDKQASAVAGNTHELGPAFSLNGSEVKHRVRRSTLRVHKIQVVIQHAGSVSAGYAIVRDELDVDGADRSRKLDGADDVFVLEIPNSNAAAEVDIAMNLVERGGRTDKIA